MGAQGEPLEVRAGARKRLRTPAEQVVYAQSLQQSAKVRKGELAALRARAEAQAAAVEEARTAACL